MSQALYRRYRPETFAEVIGQEHVTVPLSAALRQDRINHAYLFSGPRGCGKTTSARILARCLNCAQGPTPTPCGVCPSCLELARGGPGSLDVVEIDAASHGGVDDARSLREQAAFAPVRDQYKVFIIDEAHMVSPQGFNALLKLVEEPPRHVRFIFATTEPDKVIGTIRSRTHHYPFRLVPPERLTAYLGEICAQEGIEVAAAVLPLVVRAGAGSVRDSLSVLDQLISGSGPEGLTYAMAISLLGYTDSTLLDDTIDALSAGDGAAAFAAVERVLESGHEPRRFVEDLLERLRDLLVAAAVPDGASAVLRALPTDQLDRLNSQSARFGRAELSRAADFVNAALTEIVGATAPRLHLELLVARLLLPGADQGERGLGARLDRIERRISAVGPAALSTAPPPAPAARSVQAGYAGGSGAPTGSPRGSSVAPLVGASRPDRETSPAGSVPVPGSVPIPGPVQIPVPAPLPVTATEARVETAGVHQKGEPVQNPAPAQGVPTGGVASVTPDALTPPAGIDVTAIRRIWPDVVHWTTERNRTTWSLLSQHAHVLEFDGSTLILGFALPSLVASFVRGNHHVLVREGLAAVIGIDCMVEARGPAGTTPGRSESPSRPDGAVRTPQRAGAGSGAGPGVERGGDARGATRPGAGPGHPAGEGLLPAQGSAGVVVAGWDPPPGGGQAPATGSRVNAPERAPSDPPSRSAPPGAGAQGGQGLDHEVPAEPARRIPPRAGPSLPGPEVPTMAGPDEEIPWADEPWPADEPAPEDPMLAPRGLTNRTPSAPSGALGAPTPSPERVRGEFAAGEGAPSDRPKGPRLAGSRSAPTKGPTKAPTKSTPRKAERFADDEASADDPDLDSTNLVGPRVVEQILGGVIIDERLDPSP